MNMISHELHWRGTEFKHKRTTPAVLSASSLRTALNLNLTLGGRLQSLQVLDIFLQFHDSARKSQHAKVSLRHELHLVIMRVLIDVLVYILV